MHYSSALIFNFIPQVQKKVFIENTVPLIISLKRLLEQKHSPVLKDLMTYLQVRHVHHHCMMELSEMMEFDYYADPRRSVCVCQSQFSSMLTWLFSLQVTMQDNRNEVKVFFAGDEQLAAEVEFALKTAEKEREMEKRVENCNLTREPRTPTTQVRTHRGDW